MPAARSVRQFVGQLAELLGPTWSPHSHGNAQSAYIKGPFTLDVTVETTPVRASTPVTVTVHTPGTLVHPELSDQCPEITGTISNPQGLAHAIRATGVPAWTELLARLEKRTARTQEALKGFVAAAEQLAGPHAQVSYGTRPGFADLRWPGGRAMVRLDEEGIPHISHLVLQDLAASTFIEVLRALSPTQERPSSSVPPIGLTF